MKIIVENNEEWKKLDLDAESYTAERMVWHGFKEWANGSCVGYPTLWGFSNGRYSPNGEGQKILWKWSKKAVSYKITNFKQGDRKDYFLDSTWEEWDLDILSFASVNEVPKDLNSSMTRENQQGE